VSWGRNQEWPEIDLYQRNGSSRIKTVSAPGLGTLIEKATDGGWSANGRPDWLREHQSSFREATLVILGKEEPALWRCIATVILTDGTGGRFTIDVSKPDYQALPDLDRAAVVTLAHLYLGSFPPIPLDEDQAETYDGSVWKRWGEARQ
jgi:hypothetical protein